MPELEHLPEDHIYQAYGMYLLSSQHRLIRRLKRVYEPSIHGNKMWKASFLLMDYLLHNPVRRGVRVMELGCGWGPGAVFCAHRFRVQGDRPRHGQERLSVSRSDGDAERCRSGTAGGQLQQLKEHDAVPPAPPGRRRHLLLGQHGGTALRSWLGRAMASGVKRIVLDGPRSADVLRACRSLRQGRIGGPRSRSGTPWSRRGRRARCWKCVL